MKILPNLTVADTETVIPVERGERFPCRNSNGECNNCRSGYCSNWLRRSPCYDPAILLEQFHKYRKVR